MYMCLDDLPATGGDTEGDPLAETTHTTFHRAMRRQKEQRKTRYVRFQYVLIRIEEVVFTSI